MQYKMTIQGHVPSKSNCYKIIAFKRPNPNVDPNRSCWEKEALSRTHASLAKQKALIEYEKSFYIQCPCRGAMIGGYFSIEIKVFHENNRPDLDNAMKILLDCLQSCKVIKNDRQCTEIHAYKFVDKTNPRVEITITEIEL